MTTALLVLGGGQDVPPVAADLEVAGITVHIACTSTNFAQSLLSASADLVIMHQDSPDASVFENAEAVARLAPRPVIVFTRNPDADHIARAMKAGVHAYIIDGYSPARLRSVIHLAQARFQRDRVLLEELAQVNQRFEERKLVDRAKGILMAARQLREEEAYRALRKVAMHTKQRIGQVSQRVIEAARYGEAINRAGQLRMLSQRLVKLYALAAVGIRAATMANLLTDSVALVDETLGIFAKLLSQSTFGDLVEGVADAWTTLKRLLAQPARTERLRAVDEAAEMVLRRSERLTDNLEVGGFATALHVINVAGRQRMLSQRLAKATLLSLAPEGEASRAIAVQTATELNEAMAYLRDLPLTNAEISADLAHASRSCAEFTAALTECDTVAGMERMADLSEELLEQFDRLTTRYERATQAFVS